MIGSRERSGRRRLGEPATRRDEDEGEHGDEEEPPPRSSATVGTGWSPRKAVMRLARMVPGAMTALRSTAGRCRTVTTPPRRTSGRRGRRARRRRGRARPPTTVKKRPRSIAHPAPEHPVPEPGGDGDAGTAPIVPTTGARGTGRRMATRNTAVSIPSRRTATKAMPTRAAIEPVASAIDVRSSISPFRRWLLLRIQMIM